MVPNPDKILDENLWEMHLSRQFSWTRDLREMIYEKIDLKSAGLILDAGCGIGLITRELGEISGAEVHGLDIDGKLLKKARQKYPGGKFKQGSIENAPYPDDHFDVSFCHFLLMWVRRPYQAVEEMKRVTKPGGWIVCAAEPDYGAKIDYPDEYNAAAATIRALQAEGANPYFGRRLKAAFANADLKPEMGVFVDLWDDERMREEFEHVWKFCELTARGPMQKKWVENIKMRDIQALKDGIRITLLPIFWGIARKPGS